MAIRGILFEPCSPCRLSNRGGTFVVAAINSVIYLGVILILTLMPEFFSHKIYFPQDRQAALLVHSIISFILSLLLFGGVYWNKIFRCLPWTIYAAFTVMLHFFGLIYAVSYGKPPGMDVATEKMGLIGIFVGLYILFGVHVYIFWIALTYVLDLKDNKRDYQKFPSQYETDPESKNPKGLQMPIFTTHDLY